MDKAKAPELKHASEPGDGENINIPDDAQGFPIQIHAASNNLTQKGEGNYTKPFKSVIGKANLLDSNKGGFANENRGGVE